MARLIQNLESVQYDGTNGAFICGTWLAVTLISDDGETLVWATPEYDGVAHVGDYVIRNGDKDVWGRTVTAEQYAQEFFELP
ncbi:hypothetical protein [Streptomyces sp. NPDC088794]|uniref:hypothetical protein n=1 Tax=Streptomyces sp. NPDC088794 TaxID=3365902 RepID=UPI00380287B4